MSGYFTLEKKKEILKPLVAMCDESERVAKELFAKGFHLFKSMQAYEGAFGNNAEHQTFMVELGKETLGSIDGGIPSVSGGIGFQSEYLLNLISERDKKNGMSLAEFRKTSPKPWSLELDPTRAKRLQMQLENTKEFYQRKSEFDAVFAKEKTEEAHSVDNEALGSYDESYSDRFKSYCEIMSQCLSQYGFELSKKYSSKKYPVFCKHFDENIILCCGIKNYDDLLIQPNFGTVELIFHLREMSLKTSRVEVSPHVTVKDSDKFLILNCHAVVPYFLPSYSAFKSIQELKLNVMAQAEVFDIVFKEVF